MRSQDVLDAVNQIAPMREVSVTMHYAVHDHHDIINPNTLTFAPITDTIDRKTCENLRELWLHAVRHNKEAARVDFDEKAVDEPSMYRVVSAIIKALRGQVMESFVRSTTYPVPGEYKVELPVRSNMRADIISNLVPFERTRDMLLRLEDTLESPMRVLQIGHVPVDSVATLKASIAFSNLKPSSFN